MNSYVLDIETEKTIDEVGGWGNKHKMGIAVLCMKDLDSDESFVFSDSYSNAIPLDTLFEYITKSTIIGHNIIAFDWKLIQEYFYSNGFDIKVKVNMIDTKVSRMSLESITRALFDDVKMMDGALAPIEWRNGLDSKRKVVDYCLDDVNKTCNVFRYGVVNGFIEFYNGNKIKRVEVDWKDRLNNDPKTQWPSCYGGYGVSKKKYQCSRCSFKDFCKDES